MKNPKKLGLFIFCAKGWAYVFKYKLFRFSKLYEPGIWILPKLVIDLFKYSSNIHNNIPLTFSTSILLPWNVEFYQNRKMPITKLNKYFNRSRQLKSDWPSKRILMLNGLNTKIEMFSSCKKEALYTLPLITIKKLKRIQTAQKCIFLRTETNLLQLFSSIYNSPFLMGNILHKPNKYKVLLP